jgi:hypothetical protein
MDRVESDYRQILAGAPAIVLLEIFRKLLTARAVNAFACPFSLPEGNLFSFSLCYSVTLGNGSKYMNHRCKQRFFVGRDELSSARSARYGRMLRVQF